MEAAESGRSDWTAPTEIDGLYDPALEKEACGVGFVVQIDGIRSNKVREKNKHTQSALLRRLPAASVYD